MTTIKIQPDPGIDPGPNTVEFWLNQARMILNNLIEIGALSEEEAARWYELLIPAIAALFAIVKHIWPSPGPIKRSTQ